MIIGFAHISINTSKPESLISDLSKEGYKLTYKFSDLENNPAKKELLNFYHKKHEIFLMEKDNSLSIEITNHGATYTHNNQIKFDKNKSRLIISTDNSKNLKSNLIENLGFIEHEENLHLRSVIPSWCCDLEVNEQDSNITMLDNEGLTSIAFYVRNIEQVASKLVFSGVIYYSGIFNLETKNHLKIAILRLEDGLIIELIEIIKNA